MTVLELQISPIELIDQALSRISLVGMSQSEMMDVLLDLRIEFKQLTA
jgi:hypothetical protein